MADVVLFPREFVLIEGGCDSPENPSDGAFFAIERGR
jgi:hypothetical protein